MNPRYRLNGFHASGPTYKVALMLSLIGEPFEFQPVDLAAGEHKKPAYLAKNRFGQVPCLEDLENGRCLVQSGVILEYIADRSGKLGGGTLDQRLSAREWLFWDYDRLSPTVYRLRISRKSPEAIVTDLEQRAAAALKVLETHLAGRDWMVGEHPTFADVAIYGVVAYAEDAKIDLAPYPAVAAFMNRFEWLPGFAHRSALLPRPGVAA